VTKLMQKFEEIAKEILQAIEEMQAEDGEARDRFGGR